MTTQLLTSLFRRHPSTPIHNPLHFPYTYETNPYTCKRVWPPDFTTISPKHQFRLERRYRRRSKLKWARPNWIKFVKLTQWGAILFVAAYGVFYLEVGEKGGGKTAFEVMKRRWEGGSGLDEKVQVEGNRGDGNG